MTPEKRKTVNAVLLARTHADTAWRSTQIRPSDLVHLVALIVGKKTDADEKGADALSHLLSVEADVS